jgi:sugar phosphate isomerase/epimerase
MKTDHKPKYSLCELAFPDTTLEEDIELAVQSGATGLGIDEAKLGDRKLSDVARALRSAGVQASGCIPAVMSFLPGAMINGPDDIDQRIELMCNGVRRLAQLEPTSILCLTGPSGSLSPTNARKRAIEGLRAMASVADEVGVPLSFETFRHVEPQNFSIVFGLEEAVDFLKDAGRPDTPICYDIWHVWDSSPRILELTKELAARINLVHLDDYRQPTRAWADRVLPGDGVVNLPAIIAALREGGFDSWYDLEVFSDRALPDSVWNLPWLEQARRGYAGLMRAYDASLTVSA